MDKESIRKIALGFAAVSEVFGYTIGGFILGHVLDEKIKKTNPWITVSLTLIGLVLGFVRLYKVYKDSD